MKRKHLYLIASLLIALVVGGLVGWSIFIGYQQQQLNDTSTITPEVSRAFSPFGGVFGGIANTVADLLTGKDATTTPTVQLTLTEVYNAPTAGSVHYATSSVRFVDRATGHVFEKNVADGTTVRINQTTLPQVYEAFFVDNGNGVIRRYIDDSGSVTTMYTDLVATTTSDVFLPHDISALAISPDTQWIAAVRTTNEGSEVVTMQKNGGKRQEWFSSSLRGWQIEWRANSLFLTQNASKDSVGTMLVIPTKTGIVRSVIRERSGLETRVSPDGTQVLASWLDDERMPVLSVVDVASGKESPLYTYGMSTKCVWVDDHTTIICALPDALSPNTLPDDYLQGVVHTSDTLWEVDASTGSIVKIAESAALSGSSFDISHLSITHTPRSLLFRNSTTQTLWEVLFDDASVQ